MRRLNLLVLSSIVIAFVSGGFIGWIVTRVGCAEGTCTGSAIIIGLTSGIVAAFGVGIVVVLADRSFKEWREAEAAGAPPPQVGCETDESSDV